MKKIKKVVKRDVYRDGAKGKSSGAAADSRSAEATSCSRAAVVYCNQWECFTRFLCREDDPDSEAKQPFLK